MTNPVINSRIEFRIKAYKRATKQLVLLVIVAVIAALYLLPEVFRDFSFLPFYLLFIAVLIFSIAKLDRIARWNRIVLSPQSIEYYAVNFRLLSTWEDLSLSKNRGLLVFLSPVRLIMKKPIFKRNLWFDWDLDVLLGSARYFIPLSPRLWDGYNELIELIKLQRPDLFLEQKT